MTAQKYSTSFFLCFSLLITVLVTIVTGCTQVTSETTSSVTQTAEATISSASTSTIPLPFKSISSPPIEKFLFLEIWVKVEGTGIVGSTRIDKPSYYFDSGLSELHIYQGKPLTPNDWGFIGQGESLYGSAGGGVTSILNIVQQFPYKTDIMISTGKMNERYSAELISIPVVFLGVSPDGTIAFQIEARTIVLAPKESWGRAVETPILSEKYNGSLRITSSITNYGWLDLNTIHP